MTKSVIFDLGGVVIDWNPDRVLEGCYPDIELRQKMKLNMFQHPDWLELDRGTLSEADLLVRLEHRTGRTAAELQTVMQTVRDSLQTKPDTVALLEKLHASGVPLYCLSNISSDIFAYLRGWHRFWHVFSGIVISGDIKMIKPEPRIYEHVLQEFHLSASETAFVDDTVPNVAAAAAIGIHAILFSNARQCEDEIKKFLLSN